MKQDKTIRAIGYKEFKDIEDELQISRDIEETIYINSLVISRIKEQEDEESSWVAEELAWNEGDDEVPLDVLLDEDRKIRDFDKKVDYDSMLDPEDLRLLR